jgi:hypothetical protein
MSETVTQTYPFPFFGAGDATYFEWAEVHVLFAREPTDAERAEIDARVPPPLRDEDEDGESGGISWNGAYLHVGSGQFAHVEIAATYPADESDEEDLEGHIPFAADSRVTRFNQDIEAWLRHAHERCPIVVAYRPEDGESGGTELSDWHEWSLGGLDTVLAMFPPEAVARARALLSEGNESNVDDPFLYLLCGILEMAAEAED